MPKTPQHTEDTKEIQFSSSFDSTHEGSRALSKEEEALKKELREGLNQLNPDLQYLSSIRSTPPEGATHYLSDKKGHTYNPRIGGHEIAWEDSREAQKAEAAVRSRSKLATAVEGTSEPLVLNEKFILSTLKNIFGDELQLSEKKLADLTKDFEKNYRTFFVSGVWPKLKSALARTEKARNIHDINEREKFVHDKVNEVMEALAA